MPPDTSAYEIRTITLEAFADTIVPGEQRFPGDRACLGVAPGGGSVAAGAIELLEWDATGLAGGLDDFAQLLNAYALAMAEQDGFELDDEVPPFVALDYGQRADLVQRLTAPGHPEKPIWVSLALFCNMAYDSAAHMHTVDAIAQGHPGLLAMGITKPDPDGFWRFPKFSYGRELARLHPDTTPSGSPA